MKSTLTQTPKDVSSILDSDDELPDSYEESTEIPAYLNDCRFDHIELPWLDNCKPIKLSTEPQQKTSAIPEINIEEPIVKPEEDKSRVLISQGILTTRDLFFVKSIEEYCSESTLIWFIESLKNKAVPDRFRQSCLAKYLYDDFKHEVDLSNTFKANYYFELVSN